MGIVVPSGSGGELSDRTLGIAGSRGEAFRVSVLEDWLVRVRMLPDGHPRLDRTWTVVDKSGDTPPEGRPRDDLSPFSLPHFELSHSGEETVEITTGSIRLQIEQNDLRLTWLDPEDRCFASDLRGRSYSYQRRGRQVFHHLERRPDEHYYGFGEVSGPLDKSGKRVRMFNSDALGYDAETGSPLYKHYPFYITYVPELDIAYGLFYDNLSPTVFDMGREIHAYFGDYRYYCAEDGDVDYYMIFGPTVEQVVERFSKLTGRCVLPPRWSLGYQSSSMSYTESTNAQEELAAFAKRFGEERIPCDLFHMSSGYTKGPDEQRYVFNWDRKRVPDPGQMIGGFSEAGIRVAANIKPCLLLTHPKYDEVREFGGFIESADGTGPEVSMFWGGPGSYLDFTNPETREWWKRQVTEQLFDYGVTSTWNDNNEFEVQDGDAKCHGFGETFPVGQARSVQTLAMLKSSYEAHLETRTDERPFLITRSGCPGIQRYAQTWSGDNSTSWHTLRYNIPMGLGLSISGTPNTGHDVGGLTGGAPDPELLVRWVQNGAFHPRFNMHSWNPDGTATEAWMYREVLPVIRDTIEFRYRLIPYLYWLFVEASRTGRPIIRPMVYSFAHDPACRTESFDFMLGPNLLVASVLDPGARTRSVYLPEGRWWYDFHSGERHGGGQTILAEAPLDRIPLFVPEGGVIPMGRATMHAGEKPDDLRELHVFPAIEGEATFDLAEDDGITFGYRRGEETTVRIRVSSSRDLVSIAPVTSSGGFRPAYTEVDLILPASETRPVACVREPAETWTDGRDRRHFVLPVEHIPEGGP